MSFIIDEVAAFELTRKTQELDIEEKYDDNIDLVYNVIISSIIKEIKIFIKNKPFSDITLDIQSDLYMGEMIIDIIRKKDDIVVISEIKFKILNTDNEKNMYNILKQIYCWILLGKYKTNKKMRSILDTLLIRNNIKNFYKLTKVKGNNELSTTYKIVLKT